MQVTLPVRFLLGVAHFIAVLTIIFDIDDVVQNMTQVDRHTAIGDEKDEFNSVRQKWVGPWHGMHGMHGMHMQPSF